LVSITPQSKTPNPIHHEDQQEIGFIRFYELKTVFEAVTILDASAIFAVILEMLTILYPF